MNPAAPAMKRRTLLLYVIGFDLVVIVVGIGLLVPLQNWALLLLFLAAVSVAAWRGGWRVGLATTVFSMLALGIVFGEVVPQSQRLLFPVLGIAASAGARRRKRVVLPPPKPSHEELAQTLRAAEMSRQRRERLLPLAMYAGLPLLVLVIYTNISDVLIRNFSVPSVLQPLILLLAVPVLRYRDAFRPESAALHPLAIALIGYCLFVFASSNWARDVSVADTELIDLVKSLVILLLVASLAASWKALRIAMAALVAGAVLLAIISLIQVALGDPDLQFGGLATLEHGHLYGELEELRPSGPVGDPNYFARILIIAFPLAAFLGVGIRTRLAHAGLLAAAVIGLAILFTYSRGAMLAVAAMAVLLLLVGRIRLTWVTVLIAFLALAALLPTTVGRRLLTMQALVSGDADVASLDSSLDKRRVLLAAGWRLFTDHPILGVGAGNFGAHYPAYSNLIGWTGHDYTPLGVRQYAHNLYLEMAAETGLVGLLVFGLAMALALVMLARSRRALLARGDTASAALVTAIAIALAGYLISSLFLHSGYHRYLWMLLGFALAAVRLTNDARRADEA